MATKKVTITITEEMHQKGNDLSVLVLGNENFSGLISYMINKLHKRTHTTHSALPQTHNNAACVCCGLCV